MPVRGSAIGAGFGPISFNRGKSSPAKIGTSGVYQMQPGGAGATPLTVKALWTVVAAEVALVYIMRHYFRQDHAG
jgi:hypothetical protein